MKPKGLITIGACTTPPVHRVRICVSLYMRTCNGDRGQRSPPPRGAIARLFLWWRRSVEPCHPSRGTAPAYCPTWGACTASSGWSGRWTSSDPSSRTSSRRRGRPWCWTRRRTAPWCRARHLGGRREGMKGWLCAGFTRSNGDVVFFSSSTPTINNVTSTGEWPSIWAYAIQSCLPVCTAYVFACVN